MRAALLLATLILTMPVKALTNEDIDNWIRLMPQLDQWVEENPEADQQVPMQPGQSIDDLYSAQLQVLRDSGLYKDFEGLVTNAGFDSVDHWLTSTIDISKAMMSIELAQQPGLEDQLQAQLQQIRNQPAGAMPEEQRASLEAMIQSNLDMVEQAAAMDEATLAVVRQRQDDLIRLMENDGAELQ